MLTINIFLQLNFVVNHITDYSEKEKMKQSSEKKGEMRKEQPLIDGLCFEVFK